MSGIGNRARAGAIAVTLGAAVFGPQALGVATAGPLDTESSTASEAAAPTAAAAGSPRRAAVSRREPSATKGSGTAARAAASIDSGPRGAAAARTSTGARQADVIRRGTNASRSYRAPAALANVAGAASPKPQSGASSAVAPATALPSAISVSTVPQATKASAYLVGAPAAVGAVSGFLTGLGSFLGFTPGSGGFVDVVVAGLDALRRQLQNLIFKTAPTAVPDQWAQTFDNLVLGTIGATDAEANTLAYTVMEAPQHGTVEVGSDGTYSYTPQSTVIRTGGTDTFTVGVTETGLPNDLGIFSLFARTTPVAVTVTVTPSRPLLSTGSSDPYTTAFNVYNVSSKTLVYTGEGAGYRGNLASGPTEGTEYQAGQDAHFEVPREFMATVKSLQSFDLIDTASGTTQFALVMFETNGWTGSTSATCFGGTATCRVAGNGVSILDSVGTTYTLNADQAQAQADVLNKWCDSGPAKCTYTAGELVKGTLFAPATKVSADYINDSPYYLQANPIVINPNLSTTQTTEYSVGVSATIEVSLFTVASAAISAQYSQSWSESRTFSNALFYDVYAPPKQYPKDVTLAGGTKILAGTTLPDADYPTGTYREAALWIEAPINRAYLDAKVEFGNTTWILHDLSIDFPDTDRQGIWDVRDWVVLGGNPDGSDPTLVLPDGSLFKKPTTLTLPKGTKLPGKDVPPN